MTEATNLEYALQDFCTYSKKKIAEWNENCKPKFLDGKFEDGTDKVIISMWEEGSSELRALYSNGLAWFHGQRGPYYSHEKPIGVPQDYPPIRDDYDTLKSFLVRLLNQGVQVCSHRDDDELSDPANYVIWLHRNCEYDPFRRSLEKAVVELTTEQLQDTKLASLAPDYEKAFKERMERHQQVYGADLQRIPFAVSHQNLQGALARAQLESPKDEADIRMMHQFICEVSKTERLITFEEFREDYMRGRKIEPSDEELRKAFAESNPRRYIHFEETSPVFKKTLHQWCIGREAHIQAEQEFSKPLYLLRGLLNVIAELGTDGKTFRELHPLLRDQALAGYHRTSPSLRPDHHVHWGWESAQKNMYTQLLDALAPLQRNPTERDFWMEQVGSSPDLERFDAVVKGLLLGYQTKEERQTLISPLFLLFPVVKRSMNGWLGEEGFARRLGYSFDKYCFEDSKLVHPYSWGRSALIVGHHERLSESQHVLMIYGCGGGGMDTHQVLYDTASKDIQCKTLHKSDLEDIQEWFLPYLEPKWEAKP